MLALGMAAAQDLCTTPSSTEGYIITEHDLRVDSFDVTVTCAENFKAEEGEVFHPPTPCTTNGEAYTLVSPGWGGCVPIVCHRPGLFNYIYTENQLDLSQGFDVDIACAEGFEVQPPGASIAATPCNSALGGMYWVGGVGFPPGNCLVAGPTGPAVLPCPRDPSWPAPPPGTPECEDDEEDSSGAVIAIVVVAVVVGLIVAWFIFFKKKAEPAADAKAKPAKPMAEPEVDPAAEP